MRKMGYFLTCAACLGVTALYYSLGNEEWQAAMNLGNLPDGQLEDQLRSADEARINAIRREQFLRRWTKW